MRGACGGVGARSGPAIHHNAAALLSLAQLQLLLLISADVAHVSLAAAGGDTAAQLDSTDNALSHRALPTGNPVYVLSVGGGGGAGGEGGGVYLESYTLEVRFLTR